MFFKRVILWYSMVWYAMLSYAMVWYEKYGMLWNFNAMLWDFYAKVYVVKDKHSATVYANWFHGTNRYIQLIKAISTKSIQNVYDIEATLTNLKPKSLSFIDTYWFLGHFKVWIRKKTRAYPRIPSITWSLTSNPLRVHKGLLSKIWTFLNFLAQKNHNVSAFICI